MSKGVNKPAGLPVIHDRAAGIDIGSRIHVVGVPLELCEDAVQTFQAFTGDIERMADWLVSIGIKTVAMESTGVYWVPVFEVLQDRGIGVPRFPSRWEHFCFSLRGASRIQSPLEQRPDRGPDQQAEVPQAADVWARRPCAAAGACAA